MYACVYITVQKLWVNYLYFIQQESIKLIKSNIIRLSFIARYIYTYEEFIFVTEASAVQQNKNTDNKIIKIEQVNRELQYTNWQLYVQVY